MSADQEDRRIRTEREATQPSPSPYPDSRVRSEPEAAEHCNFSLPHFRRMRRNGIGPPYVQLSERRIGYRPADLDRWLAERVVNAA